jgi:hypothetical protein
MVRMSVASRPRRLGAYLRFSLVLILSLVAWPAAAQDREREDFRRRRGVVE